MERLPVDSQVVGVVPGPQLTALGDQLAKLEQETISLGLWMNTAAEAVVAFTTAEVTLLLHRPRVSQVAAMVVMPHRLLRTQQDFRVE